MRENPITCSHHRADRSTSVTVRSMCEGPVSSGTGAQSARGIMRTRAGSRPRVVRLDRRTFLDFQDALEDDRAPGPSDPPGRLPTAPELRSKESLLVLNAGTEERPSKNPWSSAASTFSWEGAVRPCPLDQRQQSHRTGSVRERSWPDGSDRLEHRHPRGARGDRVDRWLRSGGRHPGRGRVLAVLRRTARPRERALGVREGRVRSAEP